MIIIDQVNLTLQSLMNMNSEGVIDMLKKNLSTPELGKVESNLMSK